LASDDLWQTHARWNEPKRIDCRVLKGDSASFEPLVQKYSPRVFATARRYARREARWRTSRRRSGSRRSRSSKVSARGAVRALAHADDGADVLRFSARHQRNRESSFSDLSEPENDWLERFVSDPGSVAENSAAAKLLVNRVLEKLSPQARLVITLLEIEDRR